MNLAHITVCICTYKRAVLLKRLLTELGRQETGGLFTYSIVVADNDQLESGRAVVVEAARTLPVEVVYCVESRKNIALVRNKALEHARGDAIAFIDDDEYPVQDWLLRLRAACLRYEVAGVLGPVLPYFEGTPPDWLIKAGFCDRPRHETGFKMPWTECRTGNVLLRREIFAGLAEVFRPQFGTGSEDVDFFRRTTESGHSFVWCDEAIAHEIVPPERWTRSFLLKRALLRGNDSLKHPAGRFKNNLKAVIAVPLYGLALPFLLLAGHHLFMLYLVKLCDHFGRVCGILGLRPVDERAS